jgi:hypothetical protein
LLSYVIILYKASRLASVNTAFAANLLLPTLDFYYYLTHYIATNS